MYFLNTSGIVIPLSVCPFSNIKLCVFKELKDHNIGTLLEKGLNVSINSDDPAYFGGYMNDNYLGTMEALDLSYDEMGKIARNSFESSFLSESEKQKYFDQIAEVVNKYRN